MVYTQIFQLFKGWTNICFQLWSPYRAFTNHMFCSDKSYLKSQGLIDWGKMMQIIFVDWLRSRTLNIKKRCIMS